MKNTIIISMFLVLAVTTSAQQLTVLQRAKADLYQINKVFDSSRYLGFSTNILYTSDTIYGEFEHSEMSGTYVLNNRQVYYKAGDVEYIQNDSFVYNIDHDSKMLIMTRDVISGNSNLFPIKQFVDSIVTGYDTTYIIQVRDQGSLKIIEFTGRNNQLAYSRFAIYYESESFYLNKIEMDFQEWPQTINPEDSITAARWRPLKKRIVMSFSDYHNINNLEIFDNRNYVYLNRQKMTYSPSEKFKGYRFITAGVEGEENEENIELYPPPVTDEDQHP